MDVTAVRTAVAAALEPLSSDEFPLTCLRYVPFNVSPPTVYVQPASTKFDKAMNRGLDDWQFLVVLIVSRADDIASQDLLDMYLAGSGPLSIKAALEAERNAPDGALGGAADDLHVTGIDAYRVYTFGTTQFLGAEFKLRVIGTGD